MFGDFSSTRAASRVGSGRDPEAARKRRGCERCSSFREMNRARTRLIPPFLRKFPGLDVVLGSRLTIGTKRTDVGTSFLVLSWTDNQKRMSPGILGFRLERLVLDPLLGRGTFATIGEPMLKDHGSQLFQPCLALLQEACQPPWPWNLEQNRDVLLNGDDSRRSGGTSAPRAPATLANPASSSSPNRGQSAIRP